jgi:hypothetical protein
VRVTQPGGRSLGVGSISRPEEEEKCMLRFTRSITSTFLFSLMAVGPAPCQTAQRTTDARFPCRAVHTFDFWVGTFDATPWDQPTVAPTGQLHNTREYEGCVIVERWNSAKGNAGMSMAFFDTNRQVWRMVWNSDSNQSNDFEGSYSDGAMRFKGWVLDGEGKRLLASNVLQDVSPDIIRHIYSTSADNGATWVIKSDGRFVRRKE